MNAPQKPVILWDIDKTLLDPFYAARCQAAHAWEKIILPQYPQAGPFDEAALSLPDQAALYRKDLEGKPNENLKPLADVFAELLSAKGITPSALDRNALKETMEEISLKKSPFFYPGIIAILDRLNRNGYRCGIITKRTQNEIWSQHPLHKLVDPALVFTSEETDKATDEGRAKLSQRIADAGLTNTPLIMVGDQPIDALTAVAMGADYILPRYGNDDAYYEVPAIQKIFDESRQKLSEQGREFTEVRDVAALKTALMERGISLSPAYSFQHL